MQIEIKRKLKEQYSYQTDFHFANLSIWLLQVLVEAASSVVVAGRLSYSAAMWDLSSPTRDRTHVPRIARRILNHWTAREILRIDFKVKT